MTVIANDELSLQHEALCASRSPLIAACFRSAAPGAALFIATLLLSSSLLFLVEPMFAKMVLPKLGGTPAVWNTCMLFFQACLLAGYAYAHRITRRLSLRWQVVLHAVVLALPIIVLPISLPNVVLVDVVERMPLLWLLKVLGVSVGLPFFALASTAPLVQRWFGTTSHVQARDPYFLYAASNVGSMCALLAYPTLIEPILGLRTQTHLWMIGYVAFAVLVMACGVRCVVATKAATAVFETKTPTRIAWTARARWIVLSAIPSSYLLGVTTYITTDVAAVPLFWVLPLALYLLTFILVFARRPIVSHRVFVYALPTAVLIPVLFMVTHAAPPVWAGVGAHLFAFFIATMVCHGELVRSRPSSDHLTDFYLMMSVGGVLGGVFNAIAAPLLFARPLEYPLAVVFACLVCPPRRSHRQLQRSPGDRFFDLTLPLIAGGLAWAAIRLFSAPDKPIAAVIFAMSVPLLMCVRFAKRSPVRFALGIASLLLVAMLTTVNGAHLLEIHRTFFGVHRVVRSADGRFDELYHGTTLHGRQFVTTVAGSPGEPLTYYYPGGPLGSLFQSLAPNRRNNVAVIGLGVGSIAAYSSSGDQFTFFEIDPMVRSIAEDSGYFSFIARARERGARIGVVIGDARLTLDKVRHGAMNLVVLDAFSGDAIPLHLLTREALAMYLDKLDNHGIVAVHISNLYLDLEPVVANLARDAGCIALCRQDLDLTPQQWSQGKTASTWVVIARDAVDLAPLSQTGSWQPARLPSSGRVWTDDFSNVLSTIR